MLISTAQLLQQARQHHYAVGAFNVYTLEGVRAVVSAAGQAQSPAILQLLSSALELGGTALIACCMEAARQSDVPMSVHLDHCSSEATITEALTAGISSIMADGSHLPSERNVDFSQRMAVLSSSKQKTVEAELGRLSGTEDGITVAEREAHLTDPNRPAAFVDHTGVHALAVCIGNVHGTYHSPPELYFDRLAAIADRVSIPLVFHGTSGLPDDMITRAVSMGVSKFNVNTELRDAGIAAGSKYMLISEKPELVDRMQTEIEAMKHPVNSKIILFRSAGKAS